MRRMLITIICLIIITTMAFIKHALKPWSETSDFTVYYFKDAVVTSNVSSIIAPNTFSNIKVFSQIH